MTPIDMSQTGLFATGTLAWPKAGSASTTLAPAGTDEQNYPTNKATGRQAWMREMERAQASGWFQPFNESPSAFGNGNGKPTEGTSSRALPTTRSPVAFAQLAQRDTRIDGASQDPFATQEVSYQAGASTNNAVGVPQPGAVSSATEGANDTAQTIDAQKLVQESEAEVQDVVALESGSGTSLMPQGVLGFKAAALRGDGSCTADANGLLKRPSVAPFVPVSPQAALLPVESPLPSLKDLASANATAPPSQPTDDVDGPLNSSNLARAILSGQTSTRLHSAWTTEGLNLWLGMDGSAQQVSVQAAMIVSTLQQTLKSHGQRLNRVVCNGSVVFDAATSSTVTLRDFSSELERYASSSPSVEPRSFLSQKETS